MKNFDFTVNDPVGIHARPAGLLVKEASKYASVVSITKNGKSADAKRIMALMSLGVKQGDTVTVTVEGEDENSAAESIESFMKENL